MIHIPTRKTSPLADAVTQLRTDYKTKGSFTDTDLVGSMENLSSLPNGELGQFEEEFKGLSTSVEDLFADHGAVTLSEAQKDAGAVIMLAASNPAAYHGQATTIANDVSNESMDVIKGSVVGGAGSIEYFNQASIESFDEQELDKHMAYSIAFNVQASRQDEFGEAFYKTVVLTPDQAGLDLTIDRTIVMTEQRHTTSGRVTDWEERSLLDGFQDSSILRSDAIEVVPYLEEDNGNSDKFVDASLVAPKNVEVSGVSIRTAPLKIGTDMGYLGLSAHPGLVGANVLDSTDALNARIGLKNIYIKMTGEVGDGNGGTTTKSEVVRFRVERLNRSDFVKSVEGDSREMNLVFENDDLFLKPDTTTVDNSESELVGQLRDQKQLARLKIRMGGSVNLRTGAGHVHASTLSVDGVYNTDDDGNIESKVGAGSSEETNVINSLGELEVIGYDLNASRSNSNLRAHDLLLDTRRKMERYTVEMHAPITVQAPHYSDKTASDLNGLINAARVRISNNAVTALLNYAEDLENYVLNRPGYSERSQGVEGIGRYLVQPFFERVSLDLEMELNSISTHERSADVKELLVNAVREVAYRMYRDSNYQAALDALTGTAGQKPVLTIGTDPTIANHMQVVGDSRTAGIDFDTNIVTTNDRRMYGKIVFSFTRPDEQADPLSFGAHAWIPELTSTLQLERNGRSTKETTVQPRSRHVNCLPVMGMIDVKGTEILRRKVENNVVVSP